MVAGDEEFFVVTQAVHRAALWRHIGIQVDFGATEFALLALNGEDYRLASTQFASQI